MKKALRFLTAFTVLFLIVFLSSCDNGTSSAVTTYTVTFDANGHGTAPSSQTVAAGSLASEPSDPSADYYVFGGWYTEEICRNQWDFDSDTINSSLTLYASWSLYSTESYHICSDGTEQSHSFSDYYVITDQTEGTICKECTVCGYKEEVSTLTIPSGKTLYTLSIYIPDTYTGETTASFTLTGNGTASYSNEVSFLSRSLYASSTSSNTSPDTWTDVYAIYTGGQYNASKWFEISGSDSDDLVFYREDYSTFSSSSYSTFWSDVNSYLTNLSGLSLDTTETSLTSLLKSERDLFGISRWDTDGDGAFRIMFEDFGSSSVSTSNGLSGVAGAYSPSNTLTDSNGNYYYNGSDVFFLNTRLFYIYYQSLSSSNRYKAGRAMVTTLVHEYMHYLRDCVYKNWGSSTTTVSSEGLFVEEGIANYAPFAILNENQNSHVLSWLSYMNKTRPAINSSDTGAYSKTSSMNYGGGALFFAYIADTYGQSYVNNYAKSTDSNLISKTRTIMGTPFLTLYEDFLVSFVNAIGNSTSDFWYNFTELDTSSLSSVVDTCGFDVSSSSMSFSTSRLYELGFVINRWDTCPSVIKYGSEVDGMVTYLFFK
ncbi:MAG: InlB B-repeat-containing protein [Sphaerochaetaceae bacterium]|nr:InlB B-repeat-containing protein [Sphaerochaetaceae bacterium]